MQHFEKHNIMDATLWMQHFEKQNIIDKSNSPLTTGEAN